MAPALCTTQTPVPPPSYHRVAAMALHVDALTLVTRLHLLEICRMAVHLAQQQCPPPLRAGRGGAPRLYAEESLLLLVLLRTLWRLSYQEAHDWLCAWPALALACGLPQGADGRPRVPSKAQQSKRLRAAGAPASKMLFVLLVRAGLWCGLTCARDLIIDSAPILAWRRLDPDAALGHAPAHHPRPLLHGYRLHTLLCRGTGLPLLFRLSPANVHDAPFARPLLELAVRLLGIAPRLIRLDAGYWGLKLIAWIHTTLGAVAVIPWNAKRQKRRDGLPPTWTAEELGKRAMVRREMYGNLLLTIGGTIQQILENLQFAADERLIEPLWRMQVLVDRASRATTDEEMDTLDNDLLKALGELRHLRDRLHGGEASHSAHQALEALSAPQDANVLDTNVEELADELMPVGRYNARRLDDRLAATR
jgi:Transposase DDE domain